MSDDIPAIPAKRQPQKRRAIPWEEIYALWRLGTMRNADLAKRFGLDESAIRKRAQRYEWVRDMAEAVRRRTNEKLIERQADKLKRQGESKSGAERTLDDLRKSLEPDKLVDPDKTDAGAPDSAEPGANAGLPAPVEGAPGQNGQEEGGADAQGPGLPSVSDTHDPVVDLAADMRAAIVEQHCERAEDLKAIYRRMSGLIWQYLNPAGEDDQEKAINRANAERLLMMSKGDSLANHLKYLSHLADTIQKLERQSFAIDGDPRHPTIEVNTTVGVQVKQQIVDVDWDALSVEQLTALEALAIAASKKVVP